MPCRSYSISKRANGVFFTKSLSNRIGFHLPRKLSTSVSFFRKFSPQFIQRKQTIPHSSASFEVQKRREDGGKVMLLARRSKIGVENSSWAKTSTLTIRLEPPIFPACNPSDATISDSCIFCDVYIVVRNIRRTRRWQAREFINMTVWRWSSLLPFSLLDYIRVYFLSPMFLSPRGIS